MDDKDYNQLLNYLTHLIYSTDVSNIEKSRLQKEAKKYFVENNILYHQNNKKLQRVIKLFQKPTILYSLHDKQEVYLGIESTYNKIKKKFYWPRMYEDIKNYIQTCDICQRRGHEVKCQTLWPLEVKYLFHRIRIDIKGPLPITKHGNRYIIIAMNYLTKWPEARATLDIKATTVANFIYENIICRYGTPEILLFD